MNKKLVTALLSAAAAFIASVNLSESMCYAYPLVYTNTIPFIQQEQSNWCWAACALMSGRSGNMAAVNLSQTNVVTQVKGSAINVTCTDSELIAAANYVINYGGGNTSYQYYNGVKQDYFFINQFTNHNAPILKLNVYEYDGSLSNTKHAVVPYSIVYGTADSDPILYFCDPDTGQYRCYSFTELISGLAWLPMGKRYKYVAIYYHY